MSGPLVDVAQLAQDIAWSQQPVLLDVRWRLMGPPGAESYAEGHIPGAVFVDLDRELAGPPGDGGRHPLPDPAAFEAAMRVAGVTARRSVVAYDDGDLGPASRVWWLLRHFGHPDVRVLDGGIRAWVAAGHPLSTEVPSSRGGDFTRQPGRLPVVDAGGAYAIAQEGVLLDARTAERHRGENEPIDPVPGRIPGSRSAPMSELVGPDGLMRSPEDLRAWYAERGVDGKATVGTYCGSGVQASALVLGLELLGLPATLYAGSWSEWIRDASRPVATGE